MASRPRTMLIAVPLDPYPVYEIEKSHLQHALHILQQKIPGFFLCAGLYSLQFTVGLKPENLGLDGKGKTNTLFL